MSSTPNLTEDTIRRIATPESFERGRQYCDRGAVGQIVRRGDQIEAEVEGSEYTPYRIRITLSPNGIAETDCTCPYDRGGACKHVVATLLAYLHQPESVEDRPTIASLLAGLNRDQLQAVLLAMAERQPALAGEIEREVQLQQSQAAAAAAATAAGSSAARQRRTPVDASSFRRQVRAALHSLDRLRSSEAYWHVGGVVDEVRRVAEQARPFVEAGDGRDALTILEAVTEEYVAGWTDLDDSDGEAGEYFGDLDLLWAEAILSADLTPTECQAWARRFADWRAEVDDYGIDDAFSAAEQAAAEGWDDPLVRRALRGAATGQQARGRDSEDGGEDLAVGDRRLTAVRLAILERQERFDEYLNLARATGRRAELTTMLVRLGRLQEAVEYGLSQFGTVDEALALARALHERGATAEALRIAEHGLTLQSRRPEDDGLILDVRRAALARWLRDVAQQAGQPERALNAALVAMRGEPSLADYQAIQRLAGERWPSLREDLIAALRTPAGYVLPAQVDIFLHEGLVDDAIAAVQDHLYQHDLVERVVDAAVQSRPDWVIQTCLRQAEPIMDGGKSQRYEHAVRWLEKAGAASRAAGRGADWRAYLESLIARHGRKYSLVPRLKQLL
ncbi:MAG: SWIM zinc finger domain-containing protein [Chloroflexi bacterium]|nr:SWIM zinc finger domain-containing protein [Chloroflexota bacterium]